MYVVWSLATCCQQPCCWQLVASSMEAFTLSMATSLLLLLLLPACVMMNYYNVVAKRRLENLETYHFDVISVLCVGCTPVNLRETKKWEKMPSLFELIRDHAHFIYPFV